VALRVELARLPTAAFRWAGLAGARALQLGAAELPLVVQVPGLAPVVRAALLPMLESTTLLFLPKNARQIRRCRASLR
jgi:hypothetical protein